MFYQDQGQFNVQIKVIQHTPVTGRGPGVNQAFCPQHENKTDGEGESILTTSHILNGFHFKHRLKGSSKYTIIAIFYVCLSVCPAHVYE